MASARSAIVAGAGIGGLAASIALQRAGWQVQIVERANEVRELGFALLLAANAVSALERLGIVDRVIAGGYVPRSGEICGMHGRVLRRLDTTRLNDRLPRPPVVVLRPVVHGALVDASGDRVQLGRAVSGFAVEGDRVRVDFEGGSSATADMLIGADGVGSVIRRVLHPAEPPPRTTGLWAVRGVAHDVELDVDAAQYFGRGTEGGISRASERAVYWYLSVPSYRLGDSREPLAIARACAEDFDDRYRGMVAATHADDARLDELFDREPIDDWGRGPVTLLGDAAHPMLPHAGQGAAQALEDAVALGGVFDGASDVAAALRRYEQQRAPRAARIVRLSRRNARIGSVERAVGRFLRDAAIRLVPTSLLIKSYIDVVKS